MFCGDETKCFITTWKIDNFRKVILATQSIKSSVWNTENTEGSVLWRLYTTCSNSLLTFFLISLKGELNEKDYQCKMSILMSSGEVQLKRKICTFACCYNIEKNEIFQKNDLLLPQGTLTLCCRIWQAKLNPGRYLLQSALHEVNFPWSVEGFSFDSDFNKRSLYQQGNILLSMYLYRSNSVVSSARNSTHQLRVELLPDAGRLSSFIHCRIVIKHGCGQVLSSHYIHPMVSWKWDIAFYPEKCKDNYLHLEFETIVSRDTEHQLLPTPPNKLSKDFLHLCKKETLSDVTLNTEGMSFPAHKIILATRSPVFNAMFEKNRMVEGSSGVVDIEDIDLKTMDRFLVFLYGGLIENLQWEEALALYYAADKYAVLTLKQKCAEILKVGLTADNLCDALCLADKHSDEQLMSYTVDFIQDHKEVLSSSAWESLEESNGRLTSKVLRQVILKKSRMEGF